METFTATVDFSGRKCIDCKVTLKEGYLYKVVHPTEGEWDISKGSNMVYIYREKYAGDLTYIHSDVRQSEDAVKIFESLGHTPKSAEPWTVFVHGLQTFPAFQLFFIVLTVILLVMAVPLWRKLNRK